MAGIDKILLGGSTMLGVEDEEARKKSNNWRILNLAILEI